MENIISTTDNPIATSITDKPIAKKDENLLGIEKYSDALVNFIVSSATPLTIGMQGEWGTGKTSLMHLVKFDLDEKNVATSWINTWEYSLFKEAKEITPAILKGLLEDLIKTCKDKGYFGNEAKFNQVRSHLVKGAKILGNFAAQVASKKLTGTTIDYQSTESLLSEVAELKCEIHKIIECIVEDKDNPVKKVVFFVDDLDRIDPPVAVEVLESLKNIFDIDRCVFILAIDYDVVIKGLEKKFGPKTESNEREFRSFFDKIIQLPFTMPVNAYDIDNLLKKTLKNMGLNLGQNQEAEYVEFVKLTVGYIPRSIKRFVNSYSLLKNIRSIADSDTDETRLDLCLFALIGIQISYQKVFRLISKFPDFTLWDKTFASQIDVKEINVPDENFEYTDDLWEQILWCYCQKDPYLKSRAITIIKALNRIKINVEDDFSVLENALEFASMTSVDDDIESKHSIGKYQRKTYEELGGYIQQLKSGDVDDKYIEFLNYVDNDIQNMFKNKDGVEFLYSETGGISLYAKGKKRGTKFAGIRYSNNSGNPCIQLQLLKDPDNEYRLPKIDGIEISHARSYNTKYELDNLPQIEFYLVKLTDQSVYDNRIKELIISSFNVRNEDKKVLRKGMHAVKKSLFEDAEDLPN